MMPITPAERKILILLRRLRLSQQGRRNGTHETLIIRVTQDHYYLERGAMAGKLPCGDDIDSGS